MSKEYHKLLKQVCAHWTCQSMHRAHTGHAKACIEHTLKVFGRITTDVHTFFLLLVLAAGATVLLGVNLRSLTVVFLALLFFVVVSCGGGGGGEGALPVAEKLLTVGT